MNQATIAQTIVTASLFLIFTGLFIWGWKSGQFKNIEEAKYIIFRRPEEEKKQDENHSGETGGGAK